MKIKVSYTIIFLLLFIIMSLVSTMLEYDHKYKPKIGDNYYIENYLKNTWHFSGPNIKEWTIEDINNYKSNIIDAAFDKGIEISVLEFPQFAYGNMLEKNSEELSLFEEIDGSIPLGEIIVVSFDNDWPIEDAYTFIDGRRPKDMDMLNEYVEIAIPRSISTSFLLNQTYLLNIFLRKSTTKSQFVNIKYNIVVKIVGIYEDSSYVPSFKHGIDMTSILISSLKEIINAEHYSPSHSNDYANWIIFSKETVDNEVLIDAIKGFGVLKYNYNLHRQVEGVILIFREFLKLQRVTFLLIFIVSLIIAFMVNTEVYLSSINTNKADFIYLLFSPLVLLIFILMSPLNIMALSISCIIYELISFYVINNKEKLRGKYDYFRKYNKNIQS